MEKTLSHVTVKKGASGGNVIEHHFEDGTSDPHVTMTKEQLGGHILAHMGSRWDHKPFKTPSGQTLTPGQHIKHNKTGHEGRVVGQHPDSKKAEILWTKSKGSK